MINRRKTKQIQIGNIKIGSDSPISVQSMCNTDTRDVEATLRQIKELKDAGCELIRLAVLNSDAAVAIKELVKKSEVPLIADIHFNHKLAIECINNGIAALRLNPGNITKKENVEQVVKLDTEYINNWSMAMDIKILFKTVGAVFNRDGSM